MTENNNYSPIFDKKRKYNEYFTEEYVSGSDSEDDNIIVMPSCLNFEESYELIKKCKGADNKPTIIDYINISGILEIKMDNYNYMLEKSKKHNEKQKEIFNFVTEYKLIKDLMQDQNKKTIYVLPKSDYKTLFYLIENYKQYKNGSLEEEEYLKDEKLDNLKLRNDLVANFSEEREIFNLMYEKIDKFQVGYKIIFETDKFDYCNNNKYNIEFLNNEAAIHISFPLKNDYTISLVHYFRSKQKNEKKTRLKKRFKFSDLKFETQNYYDDDEIIMFIN